MQLDSFVRIYAKPEQEFLRIANEPVNKATAIFHSLFNAVLLNAGAAAVFFQEGEPTLGLFFFFVLSGLTFISILAIEAATFLAAKKEGGKGNFGAQLKITNYYLTPLFLVFFIFMAFVTAIVDVKWWLDIAAFPLVLYMND